MACAPSADRRTGAVRLPYLPGLDGLRALAVIAVLLYHANVSWLAGGFLGVEVFFVISGYLITALLLAERRARGRIDLKAFWLGRARRLLPALYLVLVVTLAYSVVFLPGEVAGLREDALAALGYVTNWYLTLGHESYFEAVGRPSLLKHLWSLAVEEQFYLLWPPLLALGLGVGAARWRERRVLALALTGAVASALLMTALYRPEVDPSRVYFGTDTRATGLLLGAALAFLWAPWRDARAERADRPVSSGRLRYMRERGRLQRTWGWTVPSLLDLAGLGALGVLVLLCLKLGEYEPSLYRGGFAVVGLASAGLIAVVVHPSARLGANLLGRQPLRWIGLRSYGIYLWHWPVFMVTRPQLDVSIEGLPLLAVRLGTTLLLAEISYRWVETPIRRGALGRAWQAMRDTEGRRRRRLRMLWAGAAVPVMVCCAVLGVAVAQAKPPSTPSYLSTKRVHIEASDQRPKPASTAESASSSTAAPAAAQKTAAAKEKPAPPADASERQPQTQAREAPANRTRQAATNDASNRALTATAIGDSVMLGAVDRLQKEIPNLTTIDARGSRQAPEAIGILRQLRTTGKLGDVVIVHMGNNGIFTAREFDEMMRVLSSARKVLVVNVTVPDGYSWVPNNKVLANGVRRYPDKAVLVDWYSASAGHPGYFWDGLHLTPQGARAYADLIAATYKQQVR